ncbi:hypothetical protein ACOTTU_23355 [Roseobacter sp. EG26]|uniref:hypothetical protein n=1 Tax=Roseobacter sp. EG26 TaxID=3412477 RepID=UPI003CE46796
MSGSKKTSRDNREPEDGGAHKKSKEGSGEQPVSGRTFWDLVYLIVFNRIMWSSLAAFLCLMVTLSFFGLSEISLEGGKLNLRIGKSPEQIAAELGQQEQERRLEIEKRALANEQEKLSEIFDGFDGTWTGVRRVSDSFADFCSWTSWETYTVEMKDFSASRNYGSGTLSIAVEVDLTMNDDYPERVNQCLNASGANTVGLSGWNVGYDLDFSIFSQGGFAKLNLVKMEDCGDSCFQFDAELRMRPNGELLFTELTEIGNKRHQLRLRAK